LFIKNKQNIAVVLDESINIKSISSKIKRIVWCGVSYSHDYPTLLVQSGFYLLNKREYSNRVTIVAII